jgi:excisionase family DNA binding protein
MFEDTIPAPTPGFMPISTAAKRLAVTEGRVRQLIKSGVLRASQVGDIWLVDRDSVERRMALGPGGGRKLTPPRAWALLYLADDQKAPWLDKSARYRVSTLLAERGLRALTSRLVDRGLPLPLRCHPSLLRQLRDDPRLMLTGATAAADLDLGLLTGDMVEAYVDDGSLEKIRLEYHLQSSREPNVVLRPVRRFASAWPIAHYAPLPAIVLDLLEDLDPRTRQLGESLLDRLSR